MAATTAPASVSMQHQKMLHFVANSPWSDEAVLTKSREMVLVWQSVICRPGKRLIPSCKKESDAAPNHSDRQTASPPLGKTGRRG
jgi:hypothetical protein